MSCLSTGESQVHETRRDASIVTASWLDVWLYHLWCCHESTTYTSPAQYIVGDCRPVDENNPLHSDQEDVSLDYLRRTIQRLDYQATGYWERSCPTEIQGSRLHSELRCRDSWAQRPVSVQQIILKLIVSHSRRWAYMLLSFIQSASIAKSSTCCCLGV